MGNTDDADDQVANVIDDERVEYVANYVIKSLKVSESKWSKMYEIEENQKLIQR